MLKFKIGDIVVMKCPFHKRDINYKVIDTFRNYWDQDVYEFESLDDVENEYGPYRPKELAHIAHDIFALAEDLNHEKV